MATRTDMTELRMDLERLRDNLVAGTLQERHAWDLLDRTGALLDQAQGGPPRGEPSHHLLVGVGGLEQPATAETAP